MGNCGGCGARRAARTQVADDGKRPAYRVTWGDGSSDVFSSMAEARMGIGAQEDAKKLRGHRMTSVRV